MKKAFTASAFTAASLASVAAFAPLPASAADILARVLSSTPVVQQVAVPRQVCSNQPVITQAQPSGAGAVLGAVAGGALGNAIGNGGGRALATVLGVVGGAAFGNSVEAGGGNGQQMQNVQQCGTQTFYENRPSHFNVVYEYQGTQYNTMMANDPGQFVRLQVTPVGAIQSAPQPGFQSAPQALAQADGTYAYSAPPPAQVYVQPAPAPVIYQSGPVYYPPPVYARPYYAPFYAPVGVSLNFGYSRGWGGGHRHWR
jgi:uncharacterized protein YcfJ